MSAFVRRRDGGYAWKTIHRDTGDWFLKRMAEPYFDLWPLDKRVTRWVVSMRVFGFRFSRVIWRRWVPYEWWAR